jgi:CBS domain-containing protein
MIREARNNQFSFAIFAFICGPNMHSRVKIRDRDPDIHLEAANMQLTDLMVPTAVASPGMSVAEVFRECVARQVPGIPFRDQWGQITGKASIRHVLKLNCIPDFMVTHAALLGDSLEALSIPQEKARRVLVLPIDDFILPEPAMIGPHSPVSKALAVMERYDTTYLFIMDGKEYLGTVSIMGIAAAVLSYG